MKVTKKSIAVGMLALGLVTTAGAGVTAAAGENGDFRGQRGGHAEIAATLVGITPEEFQARVENGEKPREILEAAGVTKEDIKAAHEQRLQERLAEAVANGRITQEEADARLAKKEEHQARHEAARTALENNDYAAWVNAHVGTPMANTVDEATFAKLVEAHRLHEAGDHEGARTIMEEIGFKGPHGKGGPRGMKGFGPHGPQGLLE